MAGTDIAARTREIIAMGEDDEGCFEGLGGGYPSNRVKTKAFRKLQREITRDMLEEAGILVGEENIS